MACSPTLNQLADDYARDSSRASLDDLRKLAGDYLKARSISILDAASIGLAFDVIFSADTVDVSHITPQMMAAWDKAYPNVPIESLSDRSTEEIAGIISGWKGKLFEVEVEQRLNAGEWVGDLHLEPEQTARIAESATQPGWDIQIFDSDGQVADVFQLKATESVSYIHDALAKYPDTPILATHEVAATMAGDGVLDSGITNEHLTSTVTDGISDATGDSISDAVIGTMPLSVILATEAYGVLTGKKSVDDAVNSGGDRLAKGAVAGAVGAAVSVVATPIAGAFAAFVTRLMLGGEKPKLKLKEYVPPSLPRMHQRLRLLTDQTKSVANPYQCQFSSAAPSVPTICDDEEILNLVDDQSRVEIERGAMDLSSYIRMKLGRYMKSMSAETLQRHVADLEMIKVKRWVHKAFDVSGVVNSVKAIFNSEYTDMLRELNERITLGKSLLRMHEGTATEHDKEVILLSGMSPEQQKQYRVAKITERIRAEREGK